MINKKISIIASILIILAIATVIGSILISDKKKEARNQDNVALNNLELGNKEEVKKEEIIKDIQSEENKKEEIIMEDVSFCGKSYKTNATKIDSINIAQRISEILSVRKYENICRNYEINTKDGDLLNIHLQPNQDGENYFDIFIYKYKIDSNYNIYILNGFDGTPEFIGKLK